MNMYTQSGRQRGFIIYGATVRVNEVEPNDLAMVVAALLSKCFWGGFSRCETRVASHPQPFRAYSEISGDQVSSRSSMFQSGAL